MGPAPRSVSTSFASFEAELEGAILHHTGAIDLYLERHHASAAAAAAVVPGGAEQQHATPRKLQALWQGDLSSGFWQTLSYGADRGEISLFDDGPLAAVSSGGGLDAAAGAAAAVSVPQLGRPVKRRPRAAPLQVGESRLEAFLQQDLQRYMSLHEQQQDSEVEQAASAQLAASLAASLHSRRSSSGSGSFVRLPDYSPADAAGDDDDDDSAPLAPAAAAAAAAAAALAALADAASPRGSSDLVPPMLAVPGAGSSSGGSSSGGASAPEPAGEQQLAAAAAAEAVRPPGALPFAMECDEDLAAQKQAARARLAELEGGAAAATSAGSSAPCGGGPHAAPVAAAGGASSKAAAAGKDWEPTGRADGGSSGAAGGSLHCSVVPQRPRGLAARPGGGLLGAGGQPGSDLAGALHQQLFGGGACKGDPLGLGPAAMVQQFKFSQAMLLGLLLCTGLLPMLWAYQGWAAGVVPGSRAAWLAAKLALWGGHAYLPAAGALLLYLLSSVLVLRPALLHFPDPELEAGYLRWSNGGKLFVDACFQGLLLLVGTCLWLRLAHGGLGDEQAASQARLLLAGVSMTSGGLPVLLLLRRARYLQHREALLAGSRLASILALVLMPLAPPGAAVPGAGLGSLPLSMPFVALAQLMGIACMQVRLATFVPCQALHVFVLLCKTYAASPLLHLAQLLGSGLFLPCLLLHSMELYSRKAFVATFGGASSRSASSPKVA